MEAERLEISIKATTEITDKIKVSYGEKYIRFFGKLLYHQGKDNEKPYSLYINFLSFDKEVIDSLCMYKGNAKVEGYLTNKVKGIYNKETKQDVPTLDANGKKTYEMIFNITKVDLGVKGNQQRITPQSQQVDDDLPF
jgi:hypothetical protein